MSYFFEPFVGRLYNNGGLHGKKLLILGESHYCKNIDVCKRCGDMKFTDCKQFTTNVLNRFLNYKQGLGNHENWMRTFTRFTNILHGYHIENERLIQFWDSVMFYNYIQKAMCEPRTPPDEEVFQNSTASFFELLHEYSPDIIIVWGERLWDRLPNCGHWGDHVLDGENGKLYYYKTENKSIPAYGIYHPSSSAFNYGHSKYLQEAIRMI